MKKILQTWDKFLFTEVSPFPLAIYRIVFGCLVITNLLSLWPARAVWWSEEGMLTIKGAFTYFGNRLDILAWLPQSPNILNVFFIILIFSALSLTFGFFTRFSAFLVFIGLTTLSHRNPVILDSGDTLLRVSAFWLMWVPSGAALSADRVKYEERQTRKNEPIVNARIQAWNYRFLQIQISLVYLIAFLWKLEGSQWRDGTAIGVALALEEFRRFPLPEFIYSSFWIHLMTWGTLVVEGSLGILIWIPLLRPWVIIAGICLHLGIDYSMNIPLFEWVMIGSLILFVDEDAVETYKRAYTRVIEFSRSKLPQKTV